MNTREAALQVLIETIEYNNNYDEVLSKYLPKVNYSGELKKLITVIFKNLLLLQFYIEKISNKKCKSFSKATRNILMLAIAEMLILKEPEYAVISSYVQLANKKERKAKGFINWVLREYTRKRTSISLKAMDTNHKISIAFSQPLWLVDRWIKEFGITDTVRLCAFYNKPPKLTIRTNLVKIQHSDLLKLLEENSVQFKQTDINDCIEILYSGNVTDIPGFREGYWVAQGFSSALVAHILDPQQNDNILDICAAPGGKTTHIASLTQNKANITALDVSENRLKKLKENINRLGLNNIKTVVGDATLINFNEKFDKILIDAPCSNTGVINKRVDARWNRKEEDILNLSKIQHDILSNICKCLKPKGELVYSTCSIDREENQDLISKFLIDHPNYALIEMIKIYPFDSEHDGFFISKLIRNE